MLIIDKNYQVSLIIVDKAGNHVNGAPRGAPFEVMLPGPYMQIINLATQTLYLIIQNNKILKKVF